MAERQILPHNSDQLYVTLDLTSAFRAFGNLHRNNGATAYALWVGGASQSLSTGGAPANRVFGAGFAVGSVDGSLWGNLKVGELLVYFAEHGQEEDDKVSGYLAPEVGGGVMAARYARRVVIVVPQADRAGAGDAGPGGR